MLHQPITAEPDAGRAARITFGQHLFDLLALDRKLGGNRVQPDEDTLCVYCDGSTDPDGYCRDCREFGR